MGNSTSSEKYTDINKEPINIPDTIPILDLGNRHGSTMYIDFIKREEVTSPIMTGLDKFNRRFVVVKIIIEGQELEYIQTFFQRYTNENLWISDFRNNFINTNGGMSSEQLELLQNLIDGKEVVLEEKHRPIYMTIKDDSINDSSELLIGKKISLSGLTTIPLTGANNNLDDTEEVQNS